MSARFARFPRTRRCHRMNKPSVDVTAEAAAKTRQSARRIMQSRGGSTWRLLPLALAITCLLLAGCAVGPDFTRPAAPDADGYTSQPLTTTTSTAGAAGAAQHFAPGADIPAQWWTLFHSRSLNALITQSLANNPDLKAAQAALNAARENVLAGHGAYYPSVSAGISGSREQDPAAALAPVPSNNAYVYNLFTPQLSISYAPDVFGLNRRSAESLQAQEQAVRFEMIATYTTLTTNVVVTAIEEASLQGQLDATRKLVGIESDTLRMLNYQLSKGYASQLDVAAQQAQLAQVKATLPALIKQLSQQRNQMAVLTGQFPNQKAAQTFTLSSLQLPKNLPVSLPSKLVAQRPDVRQAQANMHAASAAVGIATAQRLPNIQLSADVGSTALAIGKVFSAGTGFWALGAAVMAPIFEGGALRHQERAAKAYYAQAAEQYRATVLTAFQNVADTLTALKQDADALQAAAAGAKAAKVTLDLSQRQERDGYISHLALLNAQQSWLQARITLVQARADRFADTAALYQALGGGWWHHAGFNTLQAARGTQPRSEPLTKDHDEQ